LTESTIEQAAIDWLKERGRDYAFRAELAFDGEVCTMARLPDSLSLPKLIRGEVRVKS